MTQASAWLIRATEDFRHSIVVLKEARNIKYGSFVEPGQTLRISAEIIDQDDRETRLKTQGLVGDQSTVSARLTLVRYNLADTDPAKADNDAVIIKDLKSQFAQLRRAPLAPAP
jgi:3-hydroxyacyl-[acyl-carrier-protein] dehydratase